MKGTRMTRLHRSLRFMLFGVLLLSTLVFTGIASPAAFAAGGGNANRNANLGVTATRNTNVNVNIMVMGKMPAMHHGQQGQQTSEQQEQQGQQPDKGQQASSTNASWSFEQGLEGLLSGSW